MLQPKMIHMTERETVKAYGQFSKLHIKRAATFMIFTTKGMKFLKICLSSAWIKAMQIAILLQSGRRLGTKI